MPYNTASLPFTEEITGQTLLPLARVKKILAVDEDIGGISANATYAITIATELFIRHFAQQAYTVMKAEKKPRRQMQYNDLANAVSRVDNLSFLEDIVPRTTTVREFRQRKARAPANGPTLSNGQTQLDGSARPVAHRIPPEAMDISDAEMDASAGANHHSQGNGVAPGVNGAPEDINAEYHQPAGSTSGEHAGDVDMH